MEGRKGTGSNRVRASFGATRAGSDYQYRNHRQDSKQRLRKRFNEHRIGDFAMNALFYSLKGPIKDQTDLRFAFSSLNRLVILQELDCHD
jgi:hypothetical protein